MPARYIGEDHEHFGFVCSYGGGHIVIVAVLEGVSAQIVPPPLAASYHKSMGPATLGVAIAAWQGVLLLGMARWAPSWSPPPTASSDGWTNFHG